MRQVNIGIGVDNEGVQRLSGIPEDAWEAFCQQAKIHFPEAGENAWAHFISEIIVSAISHSSFILTDIPEANSKALEAKLSQVNWTTDQFFVYLFKSALKSNLFRILSFVDQPQEFGTLIITGIRPSTFQKLESLIELSVEDYFGIMLNGIEQGEIRIDPPDAFKKVAAARQGRDSNT